MNLENIKFLKSASATNDFPEDVGQEIAFVGKSNAGKSTAINAIVNRKNIARTSKTPGRTQLINFFKIDKKHSLVDLPGYGYANVSKSKRKSWEHLITKYLQKREALKAVFLIVDSRRGLSELDKVFIDFFLPMKKILHIVLTKSDKLKKREQLSVFNEVLGEYNNISVQLFSGTKKIGVDRAQQKIIDVFTK
ncbi:MAG: YihA family ribosome biogenesis GTP-binding protein [Gammaproteobacteria bacterium]|nr:YihA family ribosome biogenesis GTP-binding protein [Gammaproteobacteria bacterium]